MATGRCVFQVHVLPIELLVVVASPSPLSRVRQIGVQFMFQNMSSWICSSNKIKHVDHVFGLIDAQTHRGASSVCQMQAASPHVGRCIHRSHGVVVRRQVVCFCVQPRQRVSSFQHTFTCQQVVVRRMLAAQEAACEQSVYIWPSMEFAIHTQTVLSIRHNSKFVVFHGAISSET